MKFEFTDAPLLDVPKIAELASQLDAIHSRTLKVIKRLNDDAAKIRQQIADRWKSVDGLPVGDRNRLASQETSAAVRRLIDASEKELDAIMKKAGGAHAALIGQRVHYGHRAQVLNRTGLGSQRRANLEAAVARARPLSLAHLAQTAIATGDADLAAAVVAENDARRDADRGFSTAEFLGSFPVEAHDKAQQYIAIGDNRLQAVVLAIRAWRAGKASPLDTVSLALRGRGEDVAALADVAGTAEDAEG